MDDVQSRIMCEVEEGLFVVTFTRRGDFWGAINAERVETPGVSKGGDDNSTTIEGNIGITSEYRECPYCENQQFIKCHGCENLSCYDGQSGTAYCNYCDFVLTIKGDINALDAAEETSEVHLSSDDNSENYLHRK